MRSACTEPGGHEHSYGETLRSRGVARAHGPGLGVPHPPCGRADGRDHECPSSEGDRSDEARTSRGCGPSLDTAEGRAGRPSQGGGGLLHGLVASYRHSSRVPREPSRVDLHQGFVEECTVGDAPSVTGLHRPDLCRHLGTKREVGTRPEEATQGPVRDGVRRANEVRRGLHRLGNLVGWNHLRTAQPSSQGPSPRDEPVSGKEALELPGSVPLRRSVDRSHLAPLQRAGAWMGDVDGRLGVGDPRVERNGYGAPQRRTATTLVELCTGCFREPRRGEDPKNRESRDAV